MVNNPCKEMYFDYKKGPTSNILVKDSDIVDYLREKKSLVDSEIIQTSFKIDTMRKALDAQKKERLDEEKAVQRSLVVTA